jgi:hypothetical protein
MKEAHFCNISRLAATSEALRALSLGLANAERKEQLLLQPLSFRIVLKIVKHFDKQFILAKCLCHSRAEEDIADSNTLASLATGESLYRTRCSTFRINQYTIVVKIAVALRHDHLHEFSCYYKRSKTCASMRFEMPVADASTH